MNIERIDIIDDTLYEICYHGAWNKDFNSDIIIDLIKNRDFMRNIPRRYKQVINKHKSKSGGYAHVFLSKRFAYKISFDSITFETFIEICMAEPDNPHLPKVYDVVVVSVKPKTKPKKKIPYKIVFTKMEKLCHVRSRPIIDFFNDVVHKFYNKDIEELLQNDRELSIQNGLVNFIITIFEIKLKLEKKLGECIVDDYSDDNFMVREKTGELVITDLFI